MRRRKHRPLPTYLGITLTIAAFFLLARGVWKPGAGRLKAEGICVGDCGSNNLVSIDDLVKGVSIALGVEPIGDCRAFDADDSQTVTVDELVAGVNNALHGCDPVALGLEYLASGDLQLANQAFAAAVAASPNDDRANVYYAFSHLAATLLDDPQFRALADRAGVVITGDSHDLCNFDISLPDVAPAGAPRTGEILATARTVLLPELAAAVTLLSRVSPGVAIDFDVSKLPSCLQSFTDRTMIRIDHSDILLLTGGLNAAAATLNMVTAYDVDVDFQEMLDGPTPALLSTEDKLFTLQVADRLTIAGTLLDGALGTISQALDLAQNQADQGDHVLGTLVGDVTDAHRAKAMIDLVRQSLTGEVVLPIDIVTGEIVLMDIGLLQTERLNLSKLFSRQLPSLRAFVPGPNVDGDFDLGNFPDPTFGAIAPDLTQDKIDNFLVGGPACTSCTTDSDCDPLGLGSFSCVPCAVTCTGATQRCSSGVAECPDGTYYY